VDAITGSPDALAAGTLRADLASLLTFINNHLNQATGAHAASAISTAGAGGDLNAVNVEAGLQEIVDAFKINHFRGKDSNPGQHQTIQQPALTANGGKVLILDSGASAYAGTHLRIYADTASSATSSIWFTLNISWNGTAWVPDSSTPFVGGFRVSQTEFALFNNDPTPNAITTFTRGWRLPMSGGAGNSVFEITGNIQEMGRLGMEFNNPGAAAQTFIVGHAITFRSRSPAVTPSSITLTQTITQNFTGNPTISLVDQDGFRYFTSQTLAAGLDAFWYGTYIALA
jgi:hypothetical protein